MATRIRNIWYKFKNWLYYSPEKRYLRGKQQKGKVSYGDN